MSAPDEFTAIARLFAPLTRGAPEALGLKDDAAALPARPGFDLVVTTDTLVEGVHCPLGEAPDLIARKLLRVNLSDLAAKAAEPFGYFLNVSWPSPWDGAARERFAAGLGEDGRAFGLVLLGGDTSSTPGPMTASATLLGYVPAGRMVTRSGARPGDLVLVSGPIAGWRLGLAATRGEVDAPDLARRYRLPEPRLDLRERLLAHATASADVSDGLIADARHIAEASGVAIRLDLERVPIAEGAKAWLRAQPDQAAALRDLASGGDDYELVITAPKPLDGFSAIGEVAAGEGIEVRVDGRPVESGAGGWRHS